MRLATPRRTLAPTRRLESSAHSPVAAQTSSAEVAGFQQSPERGEVLPNRQPEARQAASREFDLDGDGIVSDFEAGYSAGLRQRRDRDARDGYARGLSAPSGRRPGGDAETWQRRQEIELREMRRERTASTTP